jgi:hypothetical protein
MTRWFSTCNFMAPVISITRHSRCYGVESMRRALAGVCAEAGSLKVKRSSECDSGSYGDS